MALDAIGTTLFSTPQSPLLSRADRLSLSPNQTRSLERTAAPVRAGDPALADPVRIRQAIDNQIATDVQRGLLTEREANSLRTALDEVEQEINAPRAAPQGGNGTIEDSTTAQVSSEVVEVTTSVSQRGWVTTTTSYADGGERSVQTYDASQDKTRTTDNSDPNSVSALLEEKLRANYTAPGAIPYADTLLSQNRLDIYA
ncbi:hypothetical protein [Terasakiella pusilla]|uniref:hypothetical protein n=1 Tax=Terasakiella pusilla TaxID=64973 RepID=UPI003AA8B0B2